jgi:hypothetical protein
MRYIDVIRYNIICVLLIFVYINILSDNNKYNRGNLNIS